MLSTTCARMQANPEPWTVHALRRTYSTLISAGRAGKSRMEQVLEWLAGSTGAAAAGGAAGTAAIAAAARAWDGVFVLDECHKAKNFTPGKEAQSTKVSTSMLHSTEDLAMLL